MRSGRRDERGAALMLAMMAVLMAGLTLAMDALSIYGKRVREDKQVATAFSEAKRSLLAYAAVQQATARRLPCPFIGSVDQYGLAAVAASCTADDGAEIGLLPWSTLQRPPMWDNTRAPIWYVVSGAFKRRTDLPLPTQPPDCSNMINRLTINGQGNYAAILFAPGKPISPAQVRDTTVNAVRSDYLEQDNASSILNPLPPPGVVNFVSQGNDFNDRVFGIECGEQAFH